MKIHLTAVLKSKAETTAKVKRVLENLVLNSRKEKGCIQYDLHQNVEDPSVFIFHEIWENREIFDLHNQQEYIKSFIGKASDLLIEKPNIIFTTKLA